MFSYTANKSLARFVFLLTIMFVSNFAVFYYKILPYEFSIYTVFFFFTVIIIYFYKFSVSPLKKISRSVAALLAGNEYNKINVHQKDEYGLIAHFFNNVTDNIKAVSYDLKEGERMASELSLASKIQSSVLPGSVPLIPYLDVVAKTRPAEEIGGDSFDIVEQNSNFFIYIGDVTGHGAPAGLIMMMVNTLFDVLLPNFDNTKDLAVKINEILKPRVNESMFMTCSFFRWNSELKKLFYTGAGHEHILIYRSSEGICEAIPAGGIALAMVDDISNIAKEKEITLRNQDTVVLYSDGITEANNEDGELYGLEKLKAVVKANGHVADSLALFKIIAEDVQSFVGDAIQKDDMTLIVLRYAENGFEAETSENLINTNWINSES